jgi:hypothetical protein
MEQSSDKRNKKMPNSKQWKFFTLIKLQDSFKFISLQNMFQKH